jgi:PASTA domain-containing protein/IPT/TIG domain-containing protein
MNRWSKGVVSVVIALSALAQAAPAGASLVTVGEPSTSPFTSATVGSAATLVDTTLSTAGANLTAPVSGTIIRWNVTGFAGGPWKLRVLTPLGGVNFKGAGTSSGQIVSSPATQTFTTSLPIQAGQMIGVDNTNSEDKIGAISGGSYAFFVPPLADGASGTGTGPANGATFTFNAQILPPPSILSITPAQGPIKGGTAVVIGGANFAELKGVSFGNTPAAGFTVDSESQITAIAPPSATLKREAISVTTVSGTATSSQPYAYKGCKVPNLHGANLKGAKKRIRKAGCGVGIVSKKPGVTVKTGHVVKQTPKPGKVLAPGTKVSVKLG